MITYPIIQKSQLDGSINSPQVNQGKLEGSEKISFIPSSPSSPLPVSPTNRDGQSGGASGLTKIKKRESLIHPS